MREGFCVSSSGALALDKKKPLIGGPTSSLELSSWKNEFSVKQVVLRDPQAGREISVSTHTYLSIPYYIYIHTFLNIPFTIRNGINDPESIFCLCLSFSVKKPNLKSPCDAGSEFLNLPPPIDEMVG